MFCYLTLFFACDVNTEDHVLHEPRTKPIILKKINIWVKLNIHHNNFWQYIWFIDILKQFELTDWNTKLLSCKAINACKVVNEMQFIRFNYFLFHN